MHTAVHLFQNPHVTGSHHNSLSIKSKYWKIELHCSAIAIWQAIRCTCHVRLIRNNFTASFRYSKKRNRNPQSSHKQQFHMTFMLIKGDLKEFDGDFSKRSMTPATHRHRPFSSYYNKKKPSRMCQMRFELSR